MSRQAAARWGAVAARELVLGSIPSCVGTDADVWFSRLARDARACIRICADCPVRTSCLAGALARGEQAGVWGGMRFGPLWTSSWVLPNRAGHTIFGRDVDGMPLRWTLSTRDRAWAEELARMIVFHGRRQALVARWVRRVGLSVQSPGSWWIGPWTEPDPGGRLEQMRALVPSILRDRPVERWPWELRLLTEFPDSAIPEAGAPTFSFRHNLDHDQAHDHEVDHGDGDHGGGDRDRRAGDHDRPGWRVA